ncbi:MAG: hypothetical protein KDB60_14035 [Propionibacteriaceae bacterium]|nr:hypothetical protein [Propionibacteriaceae bacterium]
MSWLRTARAELPLLRDLPDPGERRLPRVVVSLGPTVPGWVLRAAAPALAGALLLVAAQRLGMDPGLAWAIVWIAVAVTALWPSPGSASAAIVLAGLLIAADGYGPFDPVVLALIPLGYAAVRLAWWAQRVSLTARVEWAALARGVPQGLAVTGGTVAFGAVVFLLGGQPFALAVLAGGVALVALAWLLFARRQ